MEFELRSAASPVQEDLPPSGLDRDKMKRVQVTFSMDDSPSHELT